MLDIADIEMIRIIAEHGSMNRACEILHTTQPTLSKKLNRLEGQLNVELFLRSSGGMVPTQVAKHILENGQHLVQEIKTLQHQVALMQNMQGVQVNVGVGHSAGPLFLAKVLADYVRQPPAYTLAASTDSPKRLIHALREGSIDLAVSPLSPNDIPDDLTTALHFSEKVVAVVRPMHPILQKPTSFFQSMASIDVPFIAPSNPQHWSQHLQSFMAQMQIQPSLICDSYDMAKQLTMDSDFFTAGPISLFQQELDTGQLMAVPMPMTAAQDLLWHCCAIGKPEVLLMPAVKAVLASLSVYMEPS